MSFVRQTPRSPTLHFLPLSVHRQCTTVTWDSSSLKANKAINLNTKSLNKQGIHSHSNNSRSPKGNSNYHHSSFNSSLNSFRIKLPDMDSSLRPFSRDNMVFRLCRQFPASTLRRHHRWGYSRRDISLSNSNNSNNSRRRLRRLRLL